MAIDWGDMLDSGFIKLESGVPKDMLVTNWRKQVNFKDDEGFPRPGLVFDVKVEDGKTIEGKPKTWTTTSIRCLAALRPHIEGLGPDEAVGITVLRTGEGKKTQYAVTKN